jgi:sensor histidine kinase regulating citrate/malate metabolism
MAISVGVVFIIFYLYNNLANAFEENAKTAIHQREKEYYLAQCRLMQESSGRIRATRHDMKLHMVAINSLITENKTANAIEYINKFLVQIGESELYSNTGNLALDSIINYKLKDIAETKPNLRLNIPATIGIDDSDIVTIIGNLLDNSLEALANLNSQAEKTLTLNVALDKGTLLIKSENPYNGEIKENFATIKQGEEHGHGLKNIKRSVEKYDGYMKISHENNIFAVNILLYVKTPAQIQ